MRLTYIARAPLALAIADGGGGVFAEPVAEIVTFRLLGGADPAAFATAANNMTPFLNATGAILSRTLSVHETGVWTDHITWTSMATAKSAAATMMLQPAAGTFTALIDRGSVEMRHANIRFALPLG